MPRKMTLDDFWQRVDQSAGLTSCWPFKGPFRFGYGRVNMGGVNRAHRIAWILANGPIPSPLHVRHSCDNPPCCNPAHLLIGTHQDNEADKRARNRTRLIARPGAANSQARLTEVQVQEIRALYSTRTMSQRELAPRFGVTYQTIGKIVRRQRWASLP